MDNRKNKPMIPVGTKMLGAYIQGSSFIHISADRNSGREHPFLRKVRQTNLLSWASTCHFMSVGLNNRNGRTN